MAFFRKWRNRKLIKRYIELDEKCIALEDGGCMKRTCSMCHMLIRIDKHHCSCPHVKYSDEMQEIYRKLFPNESPYEYTWKQKVNKVRSL